MLRRLNNDEIYKKVLEIAGPYQHIDATINIYVLLIKKGIVTFEEVENVFVKKVVVEEKNANLKKWYQFWR